MSIIFQHSVQADLRNCCRSCYCCCLGFEGISHFALLIRRRAASLCAATPERLERLRGESLSDTGLCGSLPHRLRAFNHISRAVNREEAGKKQRLTRRDNCAKPTCCCCGRRDLIAEAILKRDLPPSPSPTLVRAHTHTHCTHSC